MSGHKYFAFRPPGHSVRELAVQFLNQQSGKKLSRTAWKKMPAFHINWREFQYKDGKKVGEIPRQSVPITLQSLENGLAATGTIDCNKLGLLEPLSDWLDKSIDVAPAFHLIDANSQTPITFDLRATLGDKYPFHPQLDREGRAFTSFQAILLGRVAKLRRMLVEESTHPFGNEWFENLRTLIAECVSLIDTTLHQLYFKAKYDPLPSWKFNESELGQRHGRRIMDKLRWVYQITGVMLHAKDDIAAFGRIKDLRNHLQHFDPPTFCFTLEDAVGWLNDVLGVARLNRKIRECSQAPLSIPLIELLGQPEVEFVPEPRFRRRLPQPRGVGYASTSSSLVEQSTRKARQSTGWQVDAETEVYVTKTGKIGIRQAEAKAVKANIVVIPSSVITELIRCLREAAQERDAMSAESFLAYDASEDRAPMAQGKTPQQTIK